MLVKLEQTSSQKADIDIVRDLAGRLEAKVTVEEVTYATSQLLNKKLRKLDKLKKKTETEHLDLDERMAKFEDQAARMLEQNAKNEENFVQQVGKHLEKMELIKAQ